MTAPVDITSVAAIRRSAKDVERVLMMIWRKAQSLALEGVSKQAILEAIALGNIELLLNRLGWDRYTQYLVDEMGRVLQDHYRLTGDYSIAAAAYDAPQVPRMSMVSNTAIDYMRNFAADRVVNITQQTRQALRQSVTAMQEDGVAATRIARLLGESVGLFPKWAQAAENYRERLELEGVRTADVDERVKQYKTRLIAARGLMIARTERMLALNSGMYDGYIQAAQRGLMDVSRAQLEWASGAEDYPNCQCYETDGKLVSLGETFPNGFKVPPAHPNCVCRLLLWPEGKPNYE